MTHFSENPGHVRVDRFKPNGKWYDTFMVDMTKYWGYGSTPKDALIDSMFNSSIPSIAKLAERIIWPPPVGSWYLVCLEPYHQYEYPVMIFLKP
jgi:hypothetical protein